MHYSSNIVNQHISWRHFPEALIDWCHLHASGQTSLIRSITCHHCPSKPVDLVLFITKLLVSSLSLMVTSLHEVDSGIPGTDLTSHFSWTSSPSVFLNVFTYDIWYFCKRPVTCVLSFTLWILSRLWTNIKVKVRISSLADIQASNRKSQLPVYIAI